MLLNFSPLNLSPLNIPLIGIFNIEGVLESSLSDLTPSLEAYHFTVKGDLLLTDFSVSSCSFTGIVPIAIYCDLGITTNTTIVSINAHHLIGTLSSSDTNVLSGNFITLHTAGICNTSLSECLLNILGEHKNNQGLISTNLSNLSIVFQGTVNNEVIESILNPVVCNFIGSNQNGVISTELISISSNFRTFQQFGNFDGFCGESSDYFFLCNNPGIFTATLQSDLTNVVSAFLGFTPLHGSFSPSLLCTLDFTGLTPEAIEGYLDLQNLNTELLYLGSDTTGRISFTVPELLFYINAFNYRATNCYLSGELRPLIGTLTGLVPESFYINLQSSFENSILDGFGFDTAGNLIGNINQDFDFDSYGKITIGGYFYSLADSSFSLDIFATISIRGYFDVSFDILNNFLGIVPLQISGDCYLDTNDSLFVSYGKCANWGLVETNCNNLSFFGNGIGQIFLYLDAITNLVDDIATFPIGNFTGTFIPTVFFGFIDSTLRNSVFVSNGQAFPIGNFFKTLDNIIPLLQSSQIQGFLLSSTQAPFIYDIGTAPYSISIFPELDFITGNLTGIVPSIIIINETVFALDGISLNILANGGVYRGNFVAALQDLSPSIRGAVTTGILDAKTSKILFSFDGHHSDAISGNLDILLYPISNFIGINTLSGDISSTVDIKRAVFSAITPLNLQGFLNLQPNSSAFNFTGVYRPNITGFVSSALSNCFIYSYGRNFASGSFAITLKDLTNVVFFGNTPIHAKGTIDKTLDRVSSSFDLRIPLRGYFYTTEPFPTFVGLGSHTVGNIQGYEITTALQFELFTRTRVLVYFNPILETIKPQPYSFFFGRIPIVGYFLYGETETFLPDTVFESYGVCPITPPSYEGSFSWNAPIVLGNLVAEHHIFIISFDALLDNNCRASFEGTVALHGIIEPRTLNLAQFEFIGNHSGRLGRISSNLQNLEPQIRLISQISAFFVVELETIHFFNQGTSIILADFTPSETLRPLDVCFNTKTIIRIEGLFDNQLSQFEAIDDTVFYGYIIEQRSGYLFTSLRPLTSNFIGQQDITGILHTTTKVFLNSIVSLTQGELSSNLDTFSIFRFTGNFIQLPPQILSIFTSNVTASFAGITLIQGKINTSLERVFATYIYGTVLIYGKWIGGDRMPCCYVSGCPSPSSLPANPTYEQCAQFSGPDFSCPTACPPVDVFDLDVTFEDGRHPLKRIFWTLQYIDFNFVGHAYVDIKGSFNITVGFVYEGSAEFLQEQENYFPYLPPWEGFAGSGYVELFGKIEAELPPQGINWRNRTTYEYFVGTINIVPGKLDILIDEFIGNVVPAYIGEVHLLEGPLQGGLYLRTANFGRIFADTPLLQPIIKAETIIHAIGDLQSSTEVSNFQIVGHIVVYTYAVLYPWDYSFTLQTNAEFIGKSSVFGKIIPEFDLVEPEIVINGHVEIKPNGFVQIRLLNSNCKGSFLGNHIPKYTGTLNVTTEEVVGNISSITLLYCRLFLDLDSLQSSFILLTPIQITGTLDSLTSVGLEVEGSTPLTGVILSQLQTLELEYSGMYYPMQYITLQGLTDAAIAMFDGWAPLLGDIELVTNSITGLFTYYRIIISALETELSVVIMEILTNQDSEADVFPSNFRDWVRGFINDELKPVKLYDQITGHLLYATEIQNFYEEIEGDLHYFEWKIPEVIVGEYFAVADSQNKPLIASQIQISDLLISNFDEVILNGY